MDRPIREGDRVIVWFKDGEVEYIIHQIDESNIYIKLVDGGNPSVISFNGKDWVFDEREDVKFRFEPPSDIVQQIGDPNVMINILAKMTYPNLIQMCKTSQEIKQLCRMEELWRIKLWEDFGFNIPIDRPLRHVYSEIYKAEKTIDGVDWVALEGHLDVLKWLNNLDPPIRPGVEGANWAAEVGHLHVLKWLNSLYPPIRPNSSGANYAAEEGQLDVLKWLNSFYPPIRPDFWGANDAAINGHLDVVEWLANLNPPILPR